MSLNLRPLSHELAKKAKSELNETPTKLEYGIQHLKDWITQQPHLRARTDDQWLASYLRGCKHSLERAKEKIELYYSCRSASPELYAFRHRDPRFKELLKAGSILVLPKLSKPTDPRVLIIRVKMHDPNKFSVTDFFSLFQMFQMIMIFEDDAFIVNGTISIIDLEGVTLAHVRSLTPTLLKKMVVAGQDACPIRLKAMHNVNAQPFLERIFKILVTFMNKKHKKRSFMHGKKGSALHKYVSKSILPTEYGGTAGPAQDITDYWVKKFDEFGPWLDEDETYGIDEEMKADKSKSAEIMFGIEGSFRRLEID